MKKIRIVSNGPMILEGICKLRTAGDQDLLLPEETALCRCGLSMEMPFCDGMHSAFGYQEPVAPPLAAQGEVVYCGREICVSFHREVCSHRGICYEQLPEVFTISSEVKVHPDRACAQEIIRVCQQCPSGALRYRLKGQTQWQDESPQEGWEVRIAKRRYGYDGPLEVREGIALETENGISPHASGHYVLCRCGKSKTMPFCSGEHWKEKFLDPSNDETDPHNPLGV